MHDQKVSNGRRWRKGQGKPYFADVNVRFALEGADCKTSSSAELDGACQTSVWLRSMERFTSTKDPSLPFWKVELEAVAQCMSRSPHTDHKHTYRPLPCCHHPHRLCVSVCFPGQRVKIDCELEESRASRSAHLRRLFAIVLVRLLAL